MFLPPAMTRLNFCAGLFPWLFLNSRRRRLGVFFFFFLFGGGGFTRWTYRFNRFWAQDVLLVSIVLI